MKIVLFQPLMNESNQLVTSLLGRYIMDVKAILVAGGSGTRLLPFTRYTHKTLLPLHRRPIVDYALAFIRRSGIKDITIVANKFVGQIAQHVGAGLEGENIHYVLEEKPLGVGYALNLARPYVKDSKLMIYFSDNITTADLSSEVKEWTGSADNMGCVLLGREVKDPERFGVAFLNSDDKLIDIQEKPSNPSSNVAIGGIYLYDGDFWDIMDKEMHDKGDEFTITDVNRRYLKNNNARLKLLENDEWLDCGTPDSLLEASKLAEAGVISPNPCNLRLDDPTN